MKSTAIILGFFVAGVVCGATDIIPFSIEDAQLSYYALLMLMFSVGISIGSNPDTLRSMKQVNLRLMLLPLVTVVGTVAGCAVVSLCLPQRGVIDSLIVGGGFGYYSLSTIMVTEYKGVELGTLALMSNVMREIITLLLSPLLTRWFGPLAPISVGGATSIDTTLPIITHSVGAKYIPISMFHGLSFDFIVPLLITILCSL